MKKALLILGLFIVGVVIAALVAPSFVNWNTYRDRLATQASAMLNREVTIGGDLEFRILPFPTLSVGDVSVANDRDGEYRNMLSMRDMDIRMSLMPILRGNVQIDRMILVEPVIAFERMPDETFNWSVLAAGQGLRDAVSLDRVTIENGTLHWRDHIDGAGGSFGSIFGQISAESLNGPFTAIGSLDAGGLSIALDSRMGRIGADGTASLDAGLGLDGASIDATLNGLVHWRQPRVDLEFTATGGDFSTLIRRVVDGGNWSSDDAGSIPDGVMPDRPFSLTGRLQGSPDGVGLQDASFTIDDTRIRGSVTYDTAIDPRIDVALATSRINLDALDIAPRAQTISRLIDAVAALGSDTGRNAPMVTLDLSAEAVTYRDALIRQFRFDGVAADGVLAINSLRTDLPGTTDISLVGTLREENERPFADLTLDGRSIDLRRLLSWLEVDLGDLPSDRLRRTAGSMTLRGWRDHITLTDIDVTVDTSTVRGSLDIRAPSSGASGPGADPGPDNLPGNEGATMPMLTADLFVDRLDLDAYGLTSMAARILQERIAVDWDGDIGNQIVAELSNGLGASNVSVLLSADHIVLGGHQMGGVEIDASIADGGMTVRRAVIDEINDGSVAISGSVDELRPLAGLDVLFNLETGAPGPFWTDAAIALFDAEPDLARRLTTDGVLAGHVRGDASAMEIALDARLAEVSASLRGLISDPLALKLSPTDVAEGSSPTSFDLSLRADHQDYAALLRLLGQDGAAEFIADGREAVVYADVIGTPHEVEIADIQADLAGLAVNGDGRLSIASGQAPQIEIALATSDIDADIYLPIIAAVTRRTVDGRNLPWSATVEIESSRWASEAADISVTAPAARLEFAQGAVTVDRLTGSVFGGDLSLAAGIGPSGATAEGAPEDARQAWMEGSLTGISVGSALRPLLGVRALEGEADLALSVHGSRDGQSRQSFSPESFDGSATVRWRDGGIRGMNIAAIDAALADRVGPVAFLERLQSATDRGSTSFEDATLTIGMTNGVLTFDDVELESPAAEATMRGTFDLSRWHLDLTTDFVFSDRPGAPPLSIRVAGSPASPTRQLQTGALQAFVAQQTADAIGRSINP